MTVMSRVGENSSGTLILEGGENSDEEWTTRRGHLELRKLWWLEDARAEGENTEQQWRPSYHWDGIWLGQRVAMAKGCKQISYLLPLYVFPAFSHVRLDMKMRIE